MVAAAAWMLRRTVFGRQILAVGGNEKAARLAGIPVDARQAAGLCDQRRAAPASPGLIVIAINSASDANLVGLGMELDAIAAVAVGGTLLTGGRANVLGTLLGALLIQLVRYTLLANGVPDAAALVVKAGADRPRRLAPAARRQGVRRMNSPAFLGPWRRAPTATWRASACSSRSSR